MEEEARLILSAALAGSQTPRRNLADEIRARFAPLGGVDLDIPPRGPDRPLPEFE